MIFAQKGKGSLFRANDSFKSKRFTHGFHPIENQLSGKHVKVPACYEPDSADYIPSSMGRDNQFRKQAAHSVPNLLCPYQGRNVHLLAGYYH